MPENRRPQRPAGKKTAGKKPTGKKPTGKKPAGNKTGGAKKAAGGRGAAQGRGGRPQDRRRAPDKPQRTREQAEYDGPDLPEGITGVDAYPAILAELMRRGWSDADIRKLAGENVLRVLRAAEAVARDKASERPSLARMEG